MASARSLAQSGAGWAVRIPLALAVAAVGYLAIMSSVAEVMNKTNPERAHLLASSNGRITAHLAEQRLREQPSAVNAATMQLARLALRQDATAVSAAATLAIGAQLRGDTREARRLANYSQFLSRRNLQIQLWAIEDLVSRNDIAGALRHYDMALRTSRAASTILYPVLAQAISEPAVRSNLITTLSGKPTWGPAFLAYALGSQTDPRHMASLFVGLRRVGVPVAPEASASLINRLLLVNAPEDAWRYYTSSRTGVDRRRSRDPRFVEAPAAPSQFDWITTNTDGIAASIQKNASGGIVDFSVPSGRAGTLVLQVQMLPPGTYRISGEGHSIDQASTSLPYWTLTCRNGQELGRVTVPASRNGTSTFVGRFVVPSGCPLQTLALVARPTDSVAGSTGQISRAELTPEG